MKSLTSLCSPVGITCFFRDSLSLRNFFFWSEDEIHFTTIQQLSKLETLSICGPAFRDLDKLGSLSRLKTLSVVCHPPSRQVGVIDLSVVNALPNLEWLLIKDLSNVEQNGKSNRVTTLVVLDCSFNNASFFSNFPNLEFCSVRLIDKLPVSAELFTKMPSLTELKVSNLTEIDKLCVLTNLKRLEISDVQLNAVDVRSLLSISGIESLVLMKVDIAPSLLSKLSSAIPDVQIIGSKNSNDQLEWENVIE